MMSSAVCSKMVGVQIDGFEESDGIKVGVEVTSVGADEGAGEGSDVGADVGDVDGIEDPALLGATDPFDVGSLDAYADGFVLGIQMALQLGSS